MGNGIDNKSDDEFSNFEDGECCEVICKQLFIINKQEYSLEKYI